MHDALNALGIQKLQTLERRLLTLRTCYDLTPADELMVFEYSWGATLAITFLRCRCTRDCEPVCKQHNDHDALVEELHIDFRTDHIPELQELLDVLRKVDAQRTRAAAEQHPIPKEDATRTAIPASPNGKGSAKA